MVLIAYDGSEPARDAVAAAGRLFAGKSAVVLTVWRSVREAARAARAAMPQAVIAQAVHQMDAAEEAEAAATAREGAELARQAGLDATSTTLCADPSVWGVIVRLAHEREVAALVVGSRGRSAFKSAVLGSVSNAAVHHCRRPVVVVHPHAEASDVDQPGAASSPARSD